MVKRSRSVARRATLMQEDITAANEVLNRGVLSDFFGSPGAFSNGGTEVKAFETAICNKFNYKFAISVNSWSSGLLVALLALDLPAGSEVLVPTTTMSASITAVYQAGLVPVLIDIEENFFSIDVVKAASAINQKTRAILVVHLFGHPANMEAIAALASTHNLRVVEDAAQSPGAKWNGDYVGALLDVGGFSFNYHKHIHCGEGGVIVTNNEQIAERCQLLRNHAENFPRSDLFTHTSQVGYNFRLSELHAAIGRSQLNRLDQFVGHRNRLHRKFSEILFDADYIQLPQVSQSATHSFYIYPIIFRSDEVSFSRTELVHEVNIKFGIGEIWEQTPMTEGYVLPLHQNANLRAICRVGSSMEVADRLYERDLIISPILHEGTTEGDVEDFALSIKNAVNELS